MTRAFAVRLLSLCLTVLTVAFASFAQTGRNNSDGDSTAAVIGVWKGNSNCMVKNSPCHDEVNVYRIAKVAGKPDLMTVTGSKIVDGKEIVMGSSDWKYDRQKHTLDSPDGAIHLDISIN